MSTHVLRTSAAGLFAFAAATLTVAQSASPLPLSSSDLLWRADVTDGAVQSIELHTAANGAVVFDLELAGELRAVELYPHSVRSADYQLLIQGADGTLRPGPATAPSTYRGVVEGFPNSSVAASVIDGRVRATLLLSEELPIHELQAARDFDSEAAPAEYLLFEADDVLPKHGTCALDEHPLAPEGFASVQDSNEDEAEGETGGGGGVEFDFQVCKIACDADYEFFVLNDSSVVLTEADIENVINGVSNIYEKETEILYEISTIIVRDYEDDPYTQNQAGNLLTKFRNYWNNNHKDINRDIAHLFTGRDLAGTTIGIASLGVICNKTAGYGLSQSRYSLNMANRRALTAHELGHNWNSPHCDGDSDCAIMCSGVGGCINNSKTFGVAAEKKILKTKDTVTCLSEPAPPAQPMLLSVDPPTVSAFEGGTVTVTGSDLKYVIDVRVGDKVLNETEYTPLSSTAVQLNDAVLWNLGEVAVQITTLGGSSEPVMLQVEAPEPYDLVAPTYGTSAPYELKWSGQPNSIYLLEFSESPASIVAKGFDILATPSLIMQGVLTEAGTGSLLVPQHPFTAYIRLYIQTLFFTDGDFCFEAGSDIEDTQFLPYQQ